MRVQLAGVARHHGSHVVLDGVDLTIGPHSRVGLVGRNGVGKSTLLRILAGLEQPDAGAVTHAPATLTAGYLPQEPDARRGETLLAYLARRTGVAAAERDVEESACALATDPGAGERYPLALERFFSLGGGDLEPRAATTCAELGLPVELGRPTTALSGGEAARASLAALLLARFDLLLLDEPTNDLDFDGLDRLERFVTGTRAALVVVSHDRAFLDRTVDRIVEIDPRSHDVHEWAGGWSDYAAARDEARRGAYARFADAQARRRELTELLSRRRTEARSTGGGLGNATGGADRRGTHALMTKVRQAERLLRRNELPEKPFEPWELQLELEAGERGGDRPMRLQGAVVERGSFVLGPVDLDLAPGERVAVTGRNGSGKTTLLAALLGEIELTAGSREPGRRTVVGVIGQDHFAYTGANVLLDAFCRRAGLPSLDARTLLAKFGLGADHVGRPCNTLSPGERTRAQLAELQARGVNLLVLDEPTNHLDLEAVEQLELALAGYGGTLVVVSHDRRFLEAVAPTRVVALGDDLVAQGQDPGP